MAGGGERYGGRVAVGGLGDTILERNRQGERLGGLHLCVIVQMLVFSLRITHSLQGATEESGQGSSLGFLGFPRSSERVSRLALNLWRLPSVSSQTPPTREKSHAVTLSPLYPFGSVGDWFY